MKYQKIRKNDYNECLKEAKILYGLDVMITARNEVYVGGLFGKFFQKKMIEVTVRIPEKKAHTSLKIRAIKKLMQTKQFEHENDKSESHEKTVSQFQAPLITSNVNKQLQDKKIIDSLYGNIAAKKDKELNSPLINDLNLEELRVKLGLSNNKDKKEYLVANKTNKPEDSSLFNEIQENSFHKSKNVTNESLLIDNVKNEDLIHENVKIVKNKLLYNEMSESFIDNFIKVLNHKLSPEQLNNKDELLDKSVQNLAEHIYTKQDFIASRNNRQKIFMIIGPTGVGKTTTIAKLAANFSLQQKLNVALITIDNYRIAATEQLKKYADIIGIPLHICRTPLEFSTIISEETADIILVDTSGRSQNNPEKIKEIQDFADICKNNLEKHLVISATTRNIIFDQIMQAYNKIGFERIILTKIDECEIIGNFIEVADKYNRPFSFLTNGQDVPNDIMTANSKEMAGLIINGNIN